MLWRSGREGKQGSESPQLGRGRDWRQEREAGCVDRMWQGKRSPHLSLVEGFAYREPRMSAGLTKLATKIAYTETFFLLIEMIQIRLLEQREPC